MRTFILTLAAIGCLGAATGAAGAQDSGQGDGDGIGGSMGSHSSGGHGGHHRGQGRGQNPEGPGQMVQPGRPSAATLSLEMRLNGVIVVSSQARDFTAVTLAATKSDHSVIWAQRSASVGLKTVNLISSGAATSLDDSRSAGLNSALLVNSGATVNMDTVAITTSGRGATGAFVTGDGTRLNVLASKILTRQSGAYGLEVSAGAMANLTNSEISTESDHAPAVASERNGRVTMQGGLYSTFGPDSPAISIADSLTATAIAARSSRAEALRIEGSHPVHMSLSSLKGDTFAVRIFGPEITQMAGGTGNASDLAHGFHLHTDARQETHDFGGTPPRPRAVTASLPGGPEDEKPFSHEDLTFSGGTLDGRSGVFFVSNLFTRIGLDNVTLHSESGIILKAAAAPYGALGLNGGHAELNAHHQTLTGDFVTDVVSRISLNLTDESHLTGVTSHNTDVTLDTDSTWTLTSDSAVGKLSIAGVTKADLIQSIASNGHTLSYDAINNPWLEGKTYPLPGGGTLTPGL